MMRLTTPKPVMGSVHCFKIFGLPSFEVCSITATTRFTPATRSIAPPGPLTILPGIIQFAMSPVSVTSNAPRMARSMCPPNHRERVGAREKGRSRHRRDRLLASVDQVGVNFVLSREWADAEQAVLGLQRD